MELTPEASYTAWHHLMDTLGPLRRSTTVGNKAATSDINGKVLHQNSCGHGFTWGDISRVSDIARHRAEVSCHGKTHAISTLGASPTERHIDYEKGGRR